MNKREQEAKEKIKRTIDDICLTSSINLHELQMVLLSLAGDLAMAEESIVEDIARAKQHDTELLLDNDPRNGA